MYWITVAVAAFDNSTAEKYENWHIPNPIIEKVPQIHVFVINIQAKVILGMGLMFLYADFLGDFIDKYLMTTMRVMENSLQLFL